MRSVVFLIMIISNLSLLFSAVIGRMPVTERSGVKQDSLVWVANPVPDKVMEKNDTLYVDISYVFAIEPDSADIFWGGIEITNTSEISPVRSATITSGYDSLRVITKDVYGHAYIEFSVTSDFGSATDIFLIRVEDTTYEWRSNGTDFSFSPENCIGSATTEWKAASVFDLGTAEYRLNTIEFGYGRDGFATWEIVLFDGTPTDSVLYSGTTSFNGDYSSFIEGLSAELTGSVAVVFTADSNFMSTDPSGTSDNTWIFTEGEDWRLLSDISDDYSGAWYIRLSVRDAATGIEEVFTTAQDPYLLRNYPNPFNNQTVISWNMTKQGEALVKIYNSKGELVRKYYEGSLSKGNHSLVFDSSGLNSGVYYYELSVDGKVKNSSKMLYLK